MSDQLPLIAEESDEALLLPREQMAKRFTASTVLKLELKRNYICDLLAFGFPVESIAEKTQSSTRIVKIIGAKCTEQVSRNIKDVVAVLRAKAMRATFYAEQRLPDAKLSELSVFIGVLLQRAQEAEAGGLGALQPEETAIDVETVDPRRAAFVERLKQLAPPEQKPRMDTDETRIREAVEV